MLTQLILQSQAICFFPSKPSRSLFLSQPFLHPLDFSVSKEPYPATPTLLLTLPSLHSISDVNLGTLRISYILLQLVASMNVYIAIISIHR